MTLGNRIFIAFAPQKYYIFRGRRGASEIEAESIPFEPDPDHAGVGKSVQIRAVFYAKPKPFSEAGKWLFLWE